MKLRAKRKLLFLAIVIIAVSVGLFLYQREKVSDEEINNLIKKNLPAGSKVSEVIEFLESQKIEHFGYEQGEEPFFSPTATQLRPEHKRFVVAKIRNVKREFLVTWEMNIIFYFDEQDTLIDYKIKRIGTGP